MYKGKILDARCYHCKDRFNSEDLLEMGYVIYHDENYTAFSCPHCGEEFYVYKNKGYKSHIINLDKETIDGCDGYI